MHQKQARGEKHSLVWEQICDLWLWRFDKSDICEGTPLLTYVIIQMKSEIMQPTGEVGMFMVRNQMETKVLASFPPIIVHGRLARLLL